MQNVHIEGHNDTNVYSGVKLPQYQSPLVGVYFTIFDAQSYLACFAF